MLHHTHLNRVPDERAGVDRLPAVRQGGQGQGAGGRGRVNNNTWPWVAGCSTNRLNSDPSANVLRCHTSTTALCAQGRWWSRVTVGSAGRGAGRQGPPHKRPRRWPPSHLKPFSHAGMKLGGMALPTMPFSNSNLVGWSAAGWGWAGRRGTKERGSRSVSCRAARAQWAAGQRA